MIKIAVIKEEVISILENLPDDATLAQIERAIIIETIPSAIRHVQKVEKQIQKFEKINNELTKLFRKANLNPRYFEELIPIGRVRNSANVGREFLIR